ncbi:MAG: transcriptional regulator NrdR [Candidatus Gracilibacteria bacterium]|nr:transcriptional regulator NrdR [Candidatus Gracilibacteria bacterium]
MKCPKCNHLDSKVIDSRLTDKDKSIRRRRECVKCGFRFTTFERIKASSLIVVKKDGTREPYDRTKLEEGIWKACEKRTVSQAQIDDLLNNLEEKWTVKKEIPSKQIGNDVMDALKEIDEVAYIRFASVYRQFKDVEDFKKEFNKLLNGGNGHNG